MFWLKIKGISVRFAINILKDRLFLNSVTFIKEHLFLSHGSVDKHGLAGPRWTLLVSFASGFR